MSDAAAEEVSRRAHPECTCGYWGDPIHMKQIRVLGERLARAEAEVHQNTGYSAQRMVLVPFESAKQLVEVFWSSQWETRNAAENTVCAFGCGDDPYRDFVAHEPGCEFVKAWSDLATLRKKVGCTKEPATKIAVTVVRAQGEEEPP